MRRNLAGLLLLAGLGTAPSADAVVNLPNGFADEPIIGGFTEPVGLAFVPDGRFFVVEQKTGRIWIVAPAISAKAVAFTVPDVETAGFERGLLGIAVDPAWPARPFVYVHFTRTGGSIRIRRYTAGGALADPASTALSLGWPYGVVSDIPDSTEWHNGGTLRFGPDGMLYASVGDDTYSCDAQFLRAYRGKILRLTVAALPDSGSGVAPKPLITPSDNPFSGPDEITQLLYAKGLRNPFRFQIDPATGRLYIGDVGELGWEELDESEGGEEFGWPMREGMHPYPPGEVCGGPSGLDPIWEYDRSGFTASIMAGPRYRATGGPYDFPPEYEGDVFFLDYYQGWLRRLEYVVVTDSWQPAQPASGQPNPTDWGTGLVSVTDFAVGQDGAIYYVKRSGPAEVRRIVHSVPASVEAAERPLVTVSPNPARAATGARLAVSLPASGTVDVSVYDASGRLLRTIFSGTLDAGAHEFAWDAAPGIYFARARCAGSEAVEKVAIVP